MIRKKANDIGTSAHVDEDRRNFIKTLACLLISSGLDFGFEANAKGSERKVLVVGAGISGLAAAAQLKKKGFQVHVLEARKRIGGRICTDRATLGFPCDLGAGWIHGSAGGNPITEILRSAKGKSYVTDDGSLTVFDQNGNDVTTKQGGAQGDKRYQSLVKQIEEAFGDAEGDISVEDAIRKIDRKILVDPFLLYCLSAYMEFDAGGDIRELSAKNWQDDDKYPGEDVIIPEGYDRITEQLGKGLEVDLGVKISSIDFSGTKVKVGTNHGEYSSDYCLVTVPLGVLKKEVIEFTPSLPKAKRDAISVMGLGHVNKVFCEFESCFWPLKTQYFGFHSKPAGMFCYWLNYRTFSQRNCLVAIATGNAGLELEGWTEEKMKKVIHESLKKMFGAKAKAPKRILSSRWTKDPFSLGSYSFQGLNTSAETFHEIGKSVGGKLFFAGEHTSENYPGTTHGAYLSGIRAAAELVSASRGVQAEKEEPEPDEAD